MNSPYSKIKNAYWLLHQLKRLHHRYRFRKMILMSIPVMLIVFTYLGIQIKDLYQLKNLQLSNQQAENILEENQIDELSAPKVDLASSSLSFESTEEDNVDVLSSEQAESFSDENHEEFLAEDHSFDMFDQAIEQPEAETKDGFIAGLPEKTLQLEVLSIDEKKLAYLRAKTVQISIPTASPSLLAFKPVPYVRIPSGDFLTDASTELEDVPANPFMEGEDQ